MDNPAPSTIILISGDGDFAYAVSVLASRQYRIIVLAPQHTHNDLKAQADHVYEWPNDFLSDSSPPADRVPSRDTGTLTLETTRKISRTSKSIHVYKAGQDTPTKKEEIQQIGLPKTLESPSTSNARTASVSCVGFSITESVGILQALTTVLQWVTIPL